MLDNLFQTSITLRSHLVDKVSGLDDDTLDLIPEGFERSIRWHVAHMVATPALMTYELADESSPLLSQDFLQSVKRGTNQENFSLNEDYGIKHLVEFLVETVKQLQRDGKELEGKTFKSYETLTGHIIKDLESAMSYILVHDGIHIGTVNAMLDVIEHNR